MFGALAKKIFGTGNERELKKIYPIVARINALEESIQRLSDDQLRQKTLEFKDRLQKGETLDQILPEAFAVVREASKRVLGMRHFDVQMIGGCVLHQGKIAEMRTGEGKTLVATLPAYLNALEGKGVHVVTVNDYLARRDSEWMGRLYGFLGLSVGVIVHGLNDSQRQQSYRADITYGTNNEYGFDYLRDNMKYSLDSFVQRPLHYAIVDEVDSILIDEARTPLIISGPSEESTDKYYVIDQIIPKLVQGKAYEEDGVKKTTGDYVVDEKSKSVILTEEGVGHVEQILKIPNLYEPKYIEVVHHVQQALRAHSLYKLDVDYVVKEGQVIIVDEFTGRLMPGRRWSDGLHQAVEAKEKVKIENENQTLATVTFQNFFRMYRKLSGMTGTAETEAAEFHKIYKLDVLVIPTNRPLLRKDQVDVIYKTEKEKFHAVAEEIKELNGKGQPVLVGTISIEKSERLSALLKREGVPHHVLNAKQHDREAEIVAQAGRFKAVTISTNMAGRGTDILLGGNPEFLARQKVDANLDPQRYREEYEKVLSAMKVQCEEEKKKVVEQGGLHILGTERHESRRIDNQLRGRAGRQGDPGSSHFFLSLDDDLLRIFGSERISAMMDRLGIEENEPIIHPWISKAIENAQKRVEGHNFDIRKHLLEYDDVLNQQRHLVYDMRRSILSGEGIKDRILDMIDQEVADAVDHNIPEKVTDAKTDFAGLEERIGEVFDMRLSVQNLSLMEFSRDTVGRAVYAILEKDLESREHKYGVPIFSEVSRVILISTLDGLWKDHLLSMDHLREGIGLRGYGQKDPLLEYKKEGFQIFEHMLQEFRNDVLSKLFRVQIEEKSQVEQIDPGREQPRQRVIMTRGGLPQSPMGQASVPPPSTDTVVNDGPKVGRNELCHCGSGKKFKKCHGA